MHLIGDLESPYSGWRGDMETFRREHARDVRDDLERVVGHGGNRARATETPVDLDRVASRERHLLLEEIGMLQCYTPSVETDVGWPTARSP
jgi:hypothetical protein